MPQKNYRVSVLVRTRDIEGHFTELLWRMSRQTLQPSELVVVDNFSSKDKLEDTNVGVFVANGDLVCITNGHSLPLSNMWLETGVVHFRNPEVVGVGGYFVPHKDGSIWEKLAYDLGWKRLNELSRAYVEDDFFSTINCILRKSSWVEYPFDEELPSKIFEAGKFGGEDYDWAKEMLFRGCSIIVDSRFIVYHSHKERLPQLVLKYVVWRRIRKRIRMLRRPRKPYTRLESVKPLYHNI